MYRVLYRMYDWGERLMWSLAVLSVPFWLYLALYEASTTQMVAQQQKQDANGTKIISSAKSMECLREHTSILNACRI
jgi:hypothetical protein